jgi:hypothetical protein
VPRAASLRADRGPGDFAEAAALVERYRDPPTGLAEASNRGLARRFATLDLLTLDERDFRTIPGPGGNPFRILPADL